MARHTTTGVVVIGLGRFGKSLALELQAGGTDVLGIDTDPKVVHSLAGRLTHVVEADSTDEDTMRELSVHEFDRAVVGIGSDLESSILTSSVLISLGIDNIWAKAISHSHARILSQIGVHHVIRPEHDMGKRTAHLIGGRMLDYLELDDSYALVKTTAPTTLVGIRLGDSGIRARFGVTIVGIKRQGDEFTYATAETVLRRNDIIVVSGPKTGVEAFTEVP